MDIGKIIKEERVKRNLTQEDVAQEFFVTRQLISKWENGKSYPDLDQVVKLSEYFGLSLDYLLKEDQLMVADLNFDTKKKRWWKVTIILLSAALLSVIVFFAGNALLEGPILDLDKIEIVSVKKEILPAYETENTATGEKVTVPEDVVYELQLKSKKWYVDLNDVLYYRNQMDDKNMQIIIFGKYSFFPEKSETTLELYSTRDNSLTNPELKIGKDIWLYSQSKQEKGNWETSLGDKIISWESFKE